MHLRYAFLAVSTVLLGACADQSVPVAPMAAPEASFAVSAVPDADKYIVHFAVDAVPAGFSANVTALGGSVDAAYDGIGIAVVSGLTGAAAGQLATATGVSSVDPDETFQFVDETPELVADATDVGIASPGAPQTASFFPRQWHLRAIRADAAWASGRLGSPDVKVAILDTGIDYLHPDLAGRVDLANSASFVPSDDDLVRARFPTRNVVTDLHFHGTHVAATVASNALAAAGVTSRTTLMAVKVLNVNGSGSTSGILAGIAFAADHGADVINMSLGISGVFPRKPNKGFVKTTDRAFKYARSKGVIVVVAAGNDALNLDVKGGVAFFCSAPGVICVSATGPTSQTTVNGPWQNIDSPATYTNFGRGEISVAAPGGNRASAVWAACSSSSLQIPVCRTGTFVLGIQGTSMATPHVSGLAALLVAEFGHKAEGKVRNRIANFADDLGDRGTDAFYGKGRINAANALGLK